MLRIVAPILLVVIFAAHTWLHRRTSAFLRYPAGGPIGARNGGHLRSVHYRPEAGTWLVWLRVTWILTMVAFIVSAYAWA
jgi:hypothetical protein